MNLVVDFGLINGNAYTLTVALSALVCWWPDSAYQYQILSAFLSYNNLLENKLIELAL